MTDLRGKNASGQYSDRSIKSHIIFASRCSVKKFEICLRQAIPIGRITISVINREVIKEVQI